MEPPKIDAAIPVRRGTKGYFVAAIVAQLCALARFTLMARLLGPEQLGLAATLVLTAQFFDSISDSGSDRFLIQDRDGDSPRVQSLVHMVFIGRGVFSAIGLLVFAGPIAAFYRTPALAAGLSILALAPLIFGFIHLDMRRLQRHNDFRIEGLALLASESLSLVATVIAAYFTRNFTAILYGLIVRSAVLVLVTHLRAERRYSVGYSRQDAVRLAAFALPLMINGLLLFVGSQGDRVLVANRLGLAPLGYYSAVLLLIMTPSSMLTRYIYAMHLPRIAAARDDPALRDHAAGTLAGLTLLLAVLMATGFAIVAQPMVVFLDGSKFTQSAVIVALIGVLQSSRFIRLWPNTVALGMGRSGIVLTNNIARLIGFPGAIAGAMFIGGLIGIVIGFTAGELVALATAIVLLNRASGASWLYDFDRFGIFVLSSSVVVAWAIALQRPTLVGVLLLGVATVATGTWAIRREAATITSAIQMAERLLGRWIAPRPASKAET